MTPAQQEKRVIEDCLKYFSVPGRKVCGVLYEAIPWISPDSLDRVNGCCLVGAVEFVCRGSQSLIRRTARRLLITIRGRSDDYLDFGAIYIFSDGTNQDGLVRCLEETLSRFRI